MLLKMTEKVHVIVNRLTMYRVHLPRSVVLLRLGTLQTTRTTSEIIRIFLMDYIICHVRYIF